MYGLLQPLTVTRTEIQREDGGMSVEYELISGERRLRASKLLQLPHVPAIIRANTDDARVKLELAIIENLQREDLNPVERARSFSQLVSEFGLKHVQVAAKIGKSREYVSNSIRLLGLPTDILESLSAGKISEGHARPLLMLSDRPEEQSTLFKEITFKRLTVRETEMIARKIAVEKARKKDRAFDPEMLEIEQKLSETFGTRVQIEQKLKGGKITIDFFSPDDLKAIINIVETKGVTEKRDPQEMLNNHISKANSSAEEQLRQSQQPEQVQGMEQSQQSEESPVEVSQESQQEQQIQQVPEENESHIPDAPTLPIDDRSIDEKRESDSNDNLYSISNFSL